MVEGILLGLCVLPFVVALIKSATVGLGSTPVDRQEAPNKCSCVEK